jgi:hypothetical protein
MAPGVIDAFGNVHAPAAAVAHAVRQSATAITLTAALRTLERCAVQ